MALARRLPIPVGGLDLTRMKRRHLRQVLAIESLVYPRPWSMSLFLSELSQKGTRSYIVARYDGEVIGYAGMMFTGFEAHVTNIAVDPSFHGRKVGSRLLYTIVTEAVGRGASVISLEVRVTNSVAQQMYEKFGFGEVGLRKGYYVETREDAVVMEVSDAASNEYREVLRSIRNELEAVEDL